MPFCRKIKEFFKYTDEINAVYGGSFGKMHKGLASGFTSARFFRIPSFTSADITEAQICFITGTDITTHQGLFFANTVDNSSCFIIQGGQVKLNNKNQGSGRSTVATGLVVEANTKYYFKILQSGSTIQTFLSTDGINYTQGTTVTRSRNLQNNIGYGLDNDSTNHPFFGSIYLTEETYIKLNNELWWTGLDAVQVGNWEIDGGISVFSTSNYIKLFDYFTPLKNSWEMFFKIKTGSDIKTRQSIVGQSAANCGGVWLSIGNNSTSFLDLAVGSGTSTWDVVNHVVGTHALAANTEYNIKITFDKTKYCVYINDILDISVNATQTASAYTNLIGLVQTGGNTNNYPWLGYIKVTKCYIKINDKIWWHGAKTTKGTENDHDGYNNVIKILTFLNKIRTFYKYIYGIVNKNTPIFTSADTATAGQDQVKIITNPAFYIMTSTSTVTVTRGYLVTYDLGENARQVNYINYNPICVGGSYPATMLLNVEASSDGETWDLISANFGTRNVNSQLDFITPNTYRYIRFTTGNDDSRYGNGGVNSFKINYERYDIVRDEICDKKDHNYFIDTRHPYSVATRTRQYFNTLFSSDVPGTYELIIEEDCECYVECVGAGGTAVLTSIYDDRGYLATGGSGSTFKGKMFIPAGTYSIQIGNTNGSNKDSFISNLVTCGGGGNGIARTTGGTGGAAPIIYGKVLEEIKNVAGIAGSGGSGGKGGSIPPIRIQRTLSTYDRTYTGYGAGGGGQSSEYGNACFLEAPISGFVTINKLTTGDENSYYVDTVRVF